MKYKLPVDILIIVLTLSFVGVSYFYLNPKDFEIINKNEDESIRKQEQRKPPVKITFVGDLMVDRLIRRIADNNGYEHLFESVKKGLSQSDLVVANLEGPVTNFKSIYEYDLNNKDYIFTFDPKVLTEMFDSNIKMVFLDNNHISNFGLEGLKQTINNLKKEKIDYFGVYNNRDVFYKEINDINFSFVSYNQFLRPDSEETIKFIKEARKKSDYVIVFTHWGEEYEVDPNNFQINLAHSFVDNGTDLVIGTHPHVIQSKEKYKEGYIYYSLGNFIFDQYFSPEVKCGAVVDFVFEKNKIISINDRFVELSSEKVTNFSDCKNKIKIID
jgi:poly-gamma-glutamate synthesis protein (capsule biosynthesis protein)